MSTTTTYNVQGMTCEHCVRAVTAELTGLPGIISVEVDLPSATATVTSESDLDGELVRAAVEEAGYEIGGPA